MTKGPAKVEPREAAISIKIIDYPQKVKVLNQQKEKSKCKDQNFLLNLDNEMKPNEGNCNLVGSIALSNNPFRTDES